tara:strand:- start:716 stop:1423 length:708 start_codon:yes stop_codon:yes gene_type:complete
MIDDMRWNSPNSTGWLGIDLGKESIDFLWKIVKEGEQENNLKNAKNNLAGNISQSFYIRDKDDWFYKNVLEQAIDYYMQHDAERQYAMVNGFKSNFIIKDKNNKELVPTNVTLELESFWANYQKKHEFNPLHNHSGLFSFVIWLKIPYTHEDQCKLTFLDGMGDEGKAAGEFQFVLIDSFGKIKNIPYKLGKEFEGRMLFFPSELRHLVHPFYETDENRVSISGNINFAFHYDVE